MQHWFGRMGYWTACTVVTVVSAAALPFALGALSPVLTGLSITDPPSYLELSGIIFVLGYGIAAMRWALTERSDSLNPVADPKPTAPDLPRLIERLAPELRGTPIRLSGQDHYVSVVTDRGEASVLIRLSDAIAELDGVDGMQVHRSHWVAAQAVEGYEAQGDRRFLLLTDGSKVPVSRKMLSEVERRGLVQRGIGTGRATVPVRTAMASGSKSDAKERSELSNPPV
jgi:hypothetical protein